METYIAKDFGKLLKRNALQTRRIMNSLDTNVMRVYDKNIDSLQVSVDLYANYARITDYSSYELGEDEITEICDIVSRNLYVEHDKIVYHRRQKREKGEQHQQLEDESLLVTVQENGLSFIVDLTKRIDTGLFLDHMIARKSLMENCKGLNVLNLFSYTGAFSVYAAKGGAASVTSVDLSATYCQWCEKNLQLNGFTGKQYCVINTDALSFISAEKEAGKKYDIIIFDPPSFSNSRKMENDFDVQRDYLDVITSLHALLVPKGAILFSTNLSSFTLDKRRIHGYQVREITKENAAPGFSKKKNSLRSWILEKYNEDAVLENIWRIGGKNGWYYGNWLWKIRGFLDKLVGGPGLRRGRTHPDKIFPGDALDFWRVLLADKKNKRLLLFAEMRTPGEAWLEFKVKDNVLYQTATFRPKGLLGRLYWYSVLPFHLFIFGNM
ncbi:MAG: DUF2867 domain-containing protein, partial [Sphaerochaetaceae bacterium]|nr:DUF2867 domain-containing protein [Sphaerochaetaceae bacterium]